MMFDVSKQKTTVAFEVVFAMYLQTIFKRESQKLLKKNAVYMGQLKELPMAKVKQFDQENK